MDERDRNDSKGAGFAVTRNYAPARIEHELLMKVFEVVQRGASPRRALSDGLDRDVNEAPFEAIQQAVVEHRRDQANADYVTWEPAA